MKITIYAANANGRSPNIVLEGFTLKVAELQLGKPFFQAPFFFFLSKETRTKIFFGLQGCVNLFNVKCVGVFYNIVSPTQDYLRKRVRLDLHTARSDTIFLKIMMTV